MVRNGWKVKGGRGGWYCWLDHVNDVLYEVVFLSNVDNVDEDVDNSDGADDDVDNSN